MTALAGGGSHSVARKSDGTVWAWGSDAFGQLGDNVGLNDKAPVSVQGLTNVTAVAAGEAPCSGRVTSRKVEGASSARRPLDRDDHPRSA